jgi:hypothetical protein
MQPVSKARARKLANSLLRQNKEIPWRDLAKTYGVAAGTLNRIAKSHGAWLPKDDCILIALGLTAPRKPHVKPELLPGEKETKKRIALMAKNLRNSFKEFTS